MKMNKQFDVLIALSFELLVFPKGLLLLVQV